MHIISQESAFLLIKERQLILETDIITNRVLFKNDFFRKYISRFKTVFISSKKNKLYLHK
jgi:hypothetical protein